MPESTPEQPKDPCLLSEIEMDVVAMLNGFEAAGMLHARCGALYNQERMQAGETVPLRQMDEPLRYLRHVVEVARGVWSLMVFTGRAEFLTPIRDILDEVSELECPVEFMKGVDRVADVVAQVNEARYQRLAEKSKAAQAPDPKKLVTRN